MAEQNQLADPETGELLPEDALRRFADMVALVPEGSDDDATLGMLETILGAESVDELNKPWDSASFESLEGTVLIVETITRRPSNIGQLKMFLVVQGHTNGTNKPFTFTTGSPLVVAQLVRGYVMGAFPMTVVPTIAERETAAGYKPHRLRVVADVKTPKS